MGRSCFLSFESNRIESRVRTITLTCVVWPFVSLVQYSKWQWRGRLCPVPVPVAVAVDVAHDDGDGNMSAWADEDVLAACRMSGLSNERTYCNTSLGEVTCSCVRVCVSTRTTSTSPLQLQLQPLSVGLGWPCFCCCVLHAMYQYVRTYVCVYVCIRKNVFLHF